MRHLDLDLLGIHQVLGRHPKSPGGNLLDLVGRLRLTRVEIRIFSSFAGVAARSQPVHRQGQCAMRLRTDRSQRHRLRAEPPQNCTLRLNLLKLYRRLRHKLHQVTDSNRPALPSQLLKTAIAFCRFYFDVRVQLAQHLGRGLMLLALFAVPIQPGISQVRLSRSKSQSMVVQVAFKDVLQRCRACNVRSTLEEFLAKLAVQSDGLEQLSIAITGDGRNSHPRQNFLQAGIDAPAIIGRPLGLMLVSKPHSQKRKNRSCAHGQQERDMMRIESLRGLHDKRHSVVAGVDHRFPDRRRRQQHRKRGLGFAHLAIAEQNKRPAFRIIFNCIIFNRLSLDSLQRFQSASYAAGRRESDIDLAPRHPPQQKRKLL